MKKVSAILLTAVVAFIIGFSTISFAEEEPIDDISSASIEFFQNSR